MKLAAETACAAIQELTMLLQFALSAVVTIFISILLMSFFYNWLDSRSASWDRLARLYETELNTDSSSIVQTTFSMNDRRYRGIGRVGASRKGLYLALERSYQFLHPPLLIPWSDLEAMSAQTNGRCALRIKATAAELRLEDAAVREIQRFFPADDPRPAPLAA